ncbi:glycosyltransferase [Flavobacterium antarcticum]|uniref:glycosyltransferase n=1 Tax=Flavobacterium antarcticum TaxID=271155 RepID=UPI0003B50124|nr:glycosyltransferase [Flavobacterium antarcticum]
MRILQLIDSLDAGGAERMAVHYANGLAEAIDYSALASTRKEGVLKESLSNNVDYFFVNKNNNFDVLAFNGLRKFCIQKKITHIHAHSTSFFWAVVLKLSCRKIKVIWHDHFGNRAKANSSVNKMLIRCSSFFDLVIVVNEDLKDWATTHLKCSNIIQLPNFVAPQANELEVTFLKGKPSRRIVMVANLKPPKNHLFFLEVFWKSSIHKSDWSLHFIGKDFNDTYSSDLKSYIRTNAVQNVYFYDQCTDVNFVLSQSTLGVLASTYEGFPVTLIEYSTAGLALFSTNVGECTAILKEESLLFDPKEEQLCRAKLKAITKSIEINAISFEERMLNVTNRITTEYAQNTILENYIKVLQGNND